MEFYSIKILLTYKIDMNYRIRKSCMRCTVKYIGVCFVLTLDILKTIRIKDSTKIFITFVVSK